MFEPNLLSLLCGLLGGMVRAAVGITKHYKQNECKPKPGIKYGYLGFSLLTAVLAGGATGLLANSDWRLAIVFGYAGTDLLENAYKIAMKNVSIGSWLFCKRFSVPTREEVAEWVLKDLQRREKEYNNRDDID